MTERWALHVVTKTRHVFTFIVAVFVPDLCYSQSLVRTRILSELFERFNPHK